MLCVMWRPTSIYKVVCYARAQACQETGLRAMVRDVQTSDDIFQWPSYAVSLEAQRAVADSAAQMQIP